MPSPSTPIGEVLVTRRHLFWALASVHIGLIGIPFVEFVIRGVTIGHDGFQSLGWLTYLIAAVALWLLLLLTASGIAVLLILIDTLLGFFLLSQPSTVIVLFGGGFLLLAALGAVFQGLVIRDWIVSRRNAHPDEP